MKRHFKESVLRERNQGDDPTEMDARRGVGRELGVSRSEARRMGGGGVEGRSGVWGRGLQGGRRVYAVVPRRSRTGLREWV